VVVCCHGGSIWNGGFEDKVDAGIGDCRCSHGSPTPARRMA
jgi:hypothetical protein